MDAQSAVQKPESVSTAVKLLWAALALGLVKTLVDITHLSGVAPSVFTNTVLVLVFALNGFFIFKIAAGKNWARITYLVLFIIGVLPSIPIVLGEFSRSAVLGALSVAQVGLQACALFLLFSQPGAGWFRKAVPA